MKYLLNVTHRIFMKADTAVSKFRMLAETTSGLLVSLLTTYFDFALGGFWFLTRVNLSKWSCRI